jgi:hypothetical protein
MKSRKDKTEAVFLREFVKYLSTFRGDWNDTLFVPLTFDGYQAIFKVNLIHFKSNQFVYPAPRIKRKRNHSVKPVLVKRPRLKGKQ